MVCRAQWKKFFFPWCIKRIGQEDGKDTIEDKLLDWGRLQELIDELGGENGLSSLIEILGQEISYLQDTIAHDSSIEKNYIKLQNSRFPLNWSLLYF